MRGGERERGTEGRERRGEGEMEVRQWLSHWIWSCLKN